MRQQSVTEHFQTETKNTSLRTTASVIRRRCDVPLILTPSYKCHDFLA